MASLLSTTDQSNIESSFDDLHDTFQRAVYVYIPKAQIFSNPNDYNALYGRSENQSISVEDKVYDRVEAFARILYPRAHDERTLEDTGLTSTENVVRLKIKAADYNLFHTAIYVDVDDEKFSPVTKPNPIGPFEKNYYKIYLKRDA